MRPKTHRVLGIPFLSIRARARVIVRLRLLAALFVASVALFGTVATTRLLASTGDAVVGTGSLVTESASGTAIVETGTGDAVGSGTGSVIVETETGAAVIEAGTEDGSSESSESAMSSSSESFAASSSESGAMIVSSASSESSASSVIVLSTSSSLSANGGEEASVSSLSSSISSASSASFSLSPLSAHFLPDAPFANAEPTILLEKNARIHSVEDVSQSIRIRLAGSGTELSVMPEVSEASGGYLIHVSMPATFTPGTYRLTVSWNRSREEQRLLQQFENLFTGGEEEVVVTTDVSLGMEARNGGEESEERQESEEGNVLVLVRSGATLTSPRKLETMTLTVTPKETFTGTLTEHVPAGFDVTDAKPLARIEVTANGTTIVWDRRWETGVSVQLSYTFKSPLVSPLFAFLGPVEVSGTRESTGSVSSPSSSTAITGSESAASSSAFSSIPQPLPPWEEGENAGSGSTPLTASGQTTTNNTSLSSLGGEARSGGETQTETGSSVSSSSASFASAGSGALTFLTRFFNGFNSLLASLTFNTEQHSFHFIEPHRWQLLSRNAETSGTLEAARTFTLTPKGGNSFDANAMPSFTLTKEAPAGTEGEILDSEGNLKEEKALATIISVMTSGEDVKEQVLSAILEEHNVEIAQAVSQDSTAVSTLAGGERRAQDVAEQKVTDALTHDAGNARVAQALQNNDAIASALATVVTQDVKDAVVENAVQEAMGGNGGILDFLAPASPSASDAAAEASGVSTEELGKAVVDAIAQDSTAKQEVAAAISSIPQPLSPGEEGEKQQAVRPSSAGGRSEGGGMIHVQLRDKSGKTFSPNYHFEQGSVVLVLEPEREFTPGLYTLEVTVTNPITGEDVTKTQDFAWGVLAMNTDKDRYEQGDTVTVGFGVLDDMGKILCDASLRLAVKAPSGEKSELSTSDNSIRTTGTCGVKDSTLTTPDYETSFVASESGSYTLYLEATTGNGLRSMTATVDVTHTSNIPLPGQEGGLPFIITRKAATRLYPAGKSPMEITVLFNVDFTGTITETAPSSFAISDTSPQADISFASSHSGPEGPSGPRTAASSESSASSIRWHGSWHRGQTATFTYTYDAPDISPQFFLLGPLKFSSAVPFASQP